MEFIFAIFTVLATILFIVVHRIFFEPKKSSKLPDILDVDDIVDIEDLGKRFGDMLESPYPKGWYRIYDLPERGSKKVVRLFGVRCMIVWPKNSDTISIYDPYCPHVGADLADAIMDCNECIVCPFHDLKFDANTGDLVNSDGSKGKLSLKKFPWKVAAVNNNQYVWYYPGGGIPLLVDPMELKTGWEVPVLDNIGIKSLISQERDIFSVYIRDIPENGADRLHFGAVHNAFFSIPLWLMSMKWSSEWLGPSKGEVDKHIAHLKLEGTVCLFGKPLSWTTIHVTGRQVGPALTFLSYSCPLGVKFDMLQSITPMKRFVNVVDHKVYGDNTILSKLMIYSIMMGFADQFRKDIKIWSKKKSTNAIQLVKEDGPIKSFRRWYAQFE